MAFTDNNGNGVRDIGLLERYRLGAWQKLRVLHYPMITSDASFVLTAILGDGQEVYKAVATDLDPDDQIVFSLRDPDVKAEAEAEPQGDAAPDGEPAAEGEPAADEVAVSPAESTAYEDPLFIIDPTSGAVTVKDALAFMRREEPTPIVVVATDKRGLATEKTVLLRYRGAVPGQ